MSETRGADQAREHRPMPPAKVALRHRLEHAALVLVVAVARRVPLSWLTGAGALLLRAIGPWLRQNRRALANLAIAFPDKSAAEHRAISRRMWANMGRTFAETLVLDRITDDPARIVIAPEQWRLINDDSGPCIGCTLHLGNWELIVMPFKRAGRSPAGVYKPLENPLVDGWLAATRRDFYPGGLLSKGETDDDPRSGQRTARRLIDLARKGGCIGFVCDHFDRRGTPVPFMGQTSRFTVAPAMIARHVGARFLVGHCRRIGTESRFLFEFREIPISRTDDKAADALAMTTAVFAVFETWIRATPDQWMWWNTRWVNDMPATANKSAAHAGQRAS